MKLRHLARRLAGSATARRLTVDEERLVGEILRPQEARLFSELSRADKRHAVQVLRRFDVRLPSAAVEARRAALLHDVGKSVAGLGTVGRIVATVVGPVTPRLRRYHEHERHGVAMLEQAGSHETTLDLLRGSGDPVTVEALRAADDV